MSRAGLPERVPCNPAPTDKGPFVAITARKCHPHRPPVGVNVRPLRMRDRSRPSRDRGGGGWQTEQPRLVRAAAVLTGILPVFSRYSPGFVSVSSRHLPGLFSGAFPGFYPISFRILPGILPVSPGVLPVSSRYPTGFLSWHLPGIHRISLPASSRYVFRCLPGILPLSFRILPGILPLSCKILPGSCPVCLPVYPRCLARFFPVFSQILSAVTFSCGRRPAAAPARRRSGRPRRSGPSSASYAAGWEW